MKLKLHQAVEAPEPDYMNPNERYPHHRFNNACIPAEREAEIKEIIIGEACWEHMHSMMTNSGCVYGHYGSSLVKFGKNIYQALDIFCYEREAEEIEW